MTVVLPLASPSAQGVDARGILDFLDAVEAEPTIELHSIALMRRGSLVAEGYWAPYRADDRPLVYSVSKTFTATAVGLAVGEGLLSLEDRVVDLIPGEVPAEVSDRVREITVHHLLSMSTGRDTDALPSLLEQPPEQWAATYLSLIPEGPVGSRHVYDNGASWLCGELVRQRSGLTLLEFLRPRLLEPLGIDLTWDTDGLGREFGWSGAHVQTRGLAAMGELYRCDGLWHGRRLLPEGWAASLGRPHIPTVDVDNIEWGFGYGYQVWMGREGFRLDGAYGQFSFVLPDREAVIAITSGQSYTQKLINLLWTHLVPAVGGSLEDPAADAALADRLSRLGIRPPSDSGLGSSWRAVGSLTVDPGLAPHLEEQLHLPAIDTVAVFRDGAGGFNVSLGYAGAESTLVAGAGQWLRQAWQVEGLQVPVAATAGTDGDGAVEVRILFLDSPHTLVLKLDGQGRGRVAWSVSPLQSARLEALRAH